MTVYYLSGDLFLSRAQTIGHGVNTRGRMGAGVAVDFRRRFPEMYKEYRRRCHNDELAAGSYFLWTQSDPWVLNLATQAELAGASRPFVRDALSLLAARYEAEGITSLALPRIAAGLGGLSWGEVKSLLDEIFADLPLPVFVYQEYLPGVEAQEPSPDDSDGREGDGRPILFHARGPRRWRPLSNFALTPIEVEGFEYESVEHFFQACKASSDVEHELIRTASSPKKAKRLGRRIPLRPDWEEIKIDVMRAALKAKFEQHPELRELLRSTGFRPIHEDSAYDGVWGWMDGEGQDLLGRLLVEIRDELRQL